jgi:hypothetical protein
MIALRHRLGNDEGSHARHSDLAGACHRLERPSSEENGVELLEERAEVDIRIRDDPIRFAIRSCDVPVQTRRHHVANPSHGNLSQQLGVAAV